MKNFEYESDRFSDKQKLWPIRAKREIHFASQNEHFTLYLDKNIGNIEFNILYESLEKSKDPPRDMHEMAMSLNNACIVGDYKQGTIWNDSKDSKFRDDPWKDKMSFEEWCSSEQVAKEFYKKVKNKK